jgi:hypothetical protein
VDVGRFCGLGDSDGNIRASDTYTSRAVAL